MPSNSKIQINLLSGQSVVEIIMAIAIFVTISASVVSVVVGSLISSRLGEEETRAASYASEGLEAVQSIRNQDWDTFASADDASDHGLSNSTGTWVFSGTSDIDPSGKFTRVINVNPVQRDGNGDIVTSGGSNDEETKEVVASVSWDFTSGRSNAVNMSMLLTNWQEAKGSTGGTTPTPTPTPGVGTCSSYCQGLGYADGICRANSGQCNQAGEVAEPGGDQYCTGGNNADTCCCQP